MTSSPSAHTSVTPRRSANGLLFILLAAALLLRMAWVTVQTYKDKGQLDARLGDQFEYLELGRNLLHHRELFFRDPRFDQNVYAYRTPGYPVFVALCGGNVLAIRMIQALIDTSTVLAIYLLARRWLPNTAALAAAALVAANPFLIYFTGLILTETIFTAMLAWGLYSLRPSRFGILGILLLGLMTMVRPAALGLAPFLIAVGMWSWRASWQRILGGLAGWAATTLVLLGIWAYRNAHHPALRACIWTTTNSGITTYDGFHDAATGASDQKPFLDRLLPVLRQMNEVERNRYFSQRARQWIRDHPARAAKLALAKIGRTWSPVPLSTDYGTRLYVLAGLAYCLPFDILLLLGLWRGRLPRSVKFLLVVPAIYLTAIHALSVGSLRYRIPAEPPMAVIAGSVLASGARRSDKFYANPPGSDAGGEDSNRPNDRSVPVQSPKNGPSRLDNPGRTL